MTIRNIKKNLAGAEDLLHGIGVETQARGGSLYGMHKLDTYVPTYDVEEMKRSSLTFMRLYGTDTAYTDYRRNPTGTIGIPSELGGVWEPMRTSELPICGNFIHGAYVFSSDCIVGYNDSFMQWQGDTPKVVAAGATPATTGGIGAGAWKASDLSKATINVESLKLLPLIPIAQRRTVITYQVLEFNTGSGVGGHNLKWNPSRSWVSDDIGDVWPDAALNAWDGTHSDLSSLYGITSSGVGAWERVYTLAATRNEYFPEQYGAMNDYLHDDYIPLQKLASIQGAGVVLGGRYYSSAPLIPAAGVTFYGDATISTKNPYVSCVLLSNDNISFKRITFTQDFTGPTYAIDMHPLIMDTTKSNDISFDECCLIDSGHFGISTNFGGDNYTWTNGRIIRTGRDGIDIRGGQGHILTNSCAIDTGDDAVVITNMVQDGVTTSATDFVISNWVIIRAGNINLGGSGIRVGGKRGKISDNIIYKPNRYGIAISCLDADASTRPDEIHCSGNVIFGLNTNVSDASAYLFRDVDYVTVTGGSVDCIGDSASPVGNAFYLRNNTVNPIADPSNKKIVISDLRVKGADNVLHQTVFNTRLFRLKGVVLDGCNRPTKFAQGAAYSMSRIEFHDMLAINPLSNAFFTRLINEAEVGYFELINSRIESTAAPISPCVFGDASETGKVSRVLIKNNDLDFSAVMSFVPVTYAEFDYDSSYKMVAQGTATIPNGSAASPAVTYGPIGYVPPRAWLHFAARKPVAVAVLDGNWTSSSITFTAAAAVASDTIIDWKIEPRVITYRNGLVS